MSLNSPALPATEVATGASYKKGSAWLTTKTNERNLAQQVYASDPKYKKYTQQVEKCLNSFDDVHEWADCISFLKQLLKTLQAYMQFKEIPRKLIVAKRLAQCLNPALPTGVHQRALDVYAHILAVLGSEGLKRDLALWSAGLFPFFEYAATSVKPTLLDLYDTHYLPLQAGLRPVMKAFIIALLPGLEEVTGEHFEKVLGLLDRLSGTVSPSFFIQNILLVMLTTPSARGTSLNFLSRRLPKLDADEDITFIVGRDIGLIIRAFAAALEDENLLVRRSALDLLLQAIRVDSVAIRKAHADDRTVLMRAATGVVLRRDLSLNRRLYCWLLGPEEKSERQIEYLKQYALTLLSTTLRSEMFNPSGEYSENRPFKIFISLLDKWEIGASLTEVLVYDAFKAIKQHAEKSRDGSEDMMMTPSSLYEAVEPHILWRQLLKSTFEDLVGDGTKVEAIQMILFILKTFSQDEEMVTIHLPVLYAGIADLVDAQIRQNPSIATSLTMKESLLLLEEIQSLVPYSALLRRPKRTFDDQSTNESESAILRPYLFSCKFYGITPTVTLENAALSLVPLSSIFNNFFSISLQCAELASKANTEDLKEVLSRTMSLLNNLVAKLDSPLDVAWNPSHWLSSLLISFSEETSTFPVVDRAVTLIVALHQCRFLQPSLDIDDRGTMYKVVIKLLSYLRPVFAVYHVRAVSLIWSLQELTTKPHVESILAQTLASPESRNVIEAYEAFGVLWRLTDDNLLPGFRLKIPMLVVLESLTSDDVSLRRVGETWMRCSLKSYLRVLDPILYDLLDPAVRRIAVSTTIKGKQLSGYHYELPFDQRYTNYLLDTLLAIIRFGGQGFVKTARSSAIKRSFHAGLIQSVESAGFSNPDPNYLDVLIELLLRCISSEPKPSLRATMQKINISIQTKAVDLLQAIIARGDVDLIIIDTLEATIVGKLFSCIHTAQLDLQNKLLHLLHSLISTSVAHHNVKTKDLNSLNRPASREKEHDTITRGYTTHPLLAQTLVDGIAVPTNRPILQHWIDFVLTAVPQFQPALQGVVGPLNDCVCRQLMSSLKDLLDASSKRQKLGLDVSAEVTDAEFVILLNGLERLVLLGLATSPESIASEEEMASMEKSTSEGGGLLGIVSNVFGTDTSQLSAEEQTIARSAGHKSLDDGIRTLYAIWSLLVWDTPNTYSSFDESLSLIYSRTRLRCRRVLEHFFRSHSAEVLESIIYCWSRDSTGKIAPFANTRKSPMYPEASFELVDILVASAQSAVHMICESIVARVNPTEKARKQSLNHNLSDTSLFKFLENYLQRLEGPVALQVWGRFLQLVKDLTAGTREFKAQVYLTIRCLTVLADILAHTTAMEDRRVKKELQDNFLKLLDTCVAFVGRSFDQGSWLRRPAKEVQVANGRESPLSRSGSRVDEKNEVTPPTQDVSTPGNIELVSQVIQYLGSTAVPRLRKFLSDSDKISAACSNIVYYVVSPGLKSKTRPLDVDASIVSIVNEMARIPAGFKAWRGPVTDLLNDNRLFNSSPSEALRWKSIVKMMFEADKTAFSDILAKAAAAPSANIFTNREYEMLLRSVNVRRLSFALFAGDKNQFLTQLPTILEKLVEILRTVTSPVVQSEVFLCIRVLLCRLSSHNMTGFWPVVLTELYRIFEQATVTIPPDGSEDLQLILAACKCLDYLLVLQTEEFQMHQWIFITDNVDAVYRPDNWHPEALMEQLAEIVGNLPAGDLTDADQVNSHQLEYSSHQTLRRPLLNKLRQIESMRDLMPFFSHVSIASYESIYACNGNIDWEEVERGIMEDMFDGRSEGRRS
ncbi:hypothetical protein M378DRAFT_188883 [Amanita muscaria Koide BX008]|uniref:Uncharacterized protein n=1 Tax=Amanita muscaria (strain Koide BX008) TaxID=946122 RepID=A0A0C2XQC8_AMAMK|nr:hypothetical protein M378DRAFT_188883 [Amanita muscaria Koide BX008]